MRGMKYKKAKLAERLCLVGSFLQAMHFKRMRKDWSSLE